MSSADKPVTLKLNLKAPGTSTETTPLAVLVQPAFVARMGVAAINSEPSSVVFNIVKKIPMQIAADARGITKSTVSRRVAASIDILAKKIRREM